MKKFIAMLLVFAMLFSVAALLTGCDDDGKKKTSSSKKDDDDEEEEEEEENEGKKPTDPTAPTDPDDPTQPPEPTEYVFDDTDGGPALYKVTDADGDVIWLFGTIHVGRDEFYPLPDYVLEAYAQSQALAVEADIVDFEQDMTAQTQMLTKLMYTDGTMISSHIPSELYASAKDIMADNGQYSFMMDFFSPALWYQTINSLMVMNTGADVEQGIDRYFLNDAKENGKTIVEVESVAFQYDMMAGFSPELQVLLLQMAVEGYYAPDATKAEVEALMDLWQSGNEAAFARYLAGSDETEILPYENYEALMAEYDNAMTVERNETMTQYAVEALENGDALFICVGAAHVFGEDGMADNLREMGYQVELIHS